MTLVELTTAVYTITNRPDRVNETALAIQAATLKAHQLDYFYKDLYETGVAFDTAAFIQQLDYRTLLPRYRAVKYLRKYNNLTATPGRFLTLIPPEMSLDRYQVEKTNIFYVAGAYINIKMDTQEQYFLSGWYLNPDISIPTYSSWVALDHPFAIIYAAAAQVFKDIGKDEEADRYGNPKTGLVAEQYSMLKISNIQPEGY